MSSTMSNATKGNTVHAATEPSRNGSAGRTRRLLNKVAIITGAANGIGRAMAEKFSREGASVVVADIDREAAILVANGIMKNDGRAKPLVVDISNAEQVADLVADTKKEFGRLDILVNNAGIGLNKPFLDTTLTEWRHMLDVVLTGTFLCSQAAAREMVGQGRGAIVNVASISGQRGAQGRAAYGVAKAGVIQLTKTMAVELAHLGVRVNAISPGPVDTEQSRTTHTPATRNSYHDRIPLKRYGERDEIAAAALFLASDEASFVHGHVLNVDGGFHSAGLIFDPEA